MACPKAKKYYACNNKRKDSQMATTTTTKDYPKIMEIQKRMLEIHSERDNLAKDLMRELGNGDVPGINLDNLSKFARQVIRLNKEFEILSKLHRELMGY
jgi:hypothetical protein